MFVELGYRGGPGPKIYISFITPRSLLRMGYCRHCTRTSVRTSVRPYVRPSEIFFEIFGFLGSSRW